MNWPLLAALAVNFFVLWPALIWCGLHAGTWVASLPEVADPGVNWIPIFVVVLVCLALLGRRGHDNA